MISVTSLTRLRGIKLTRHGNVSLCVIEDFSEELRDLIKKNLVSICHGKAKAQHKRTLYSFERTLNDFLERYETKPYKTQVGMIGELLSHIILIDCFDNLDSINPFFNMEERSIKKGFDLILVDEEDNKKIWITEVKSGHMGKSQCPDTKNRTLLGIAKNDLKNRLNDNDSHLWHNAINGASIAMKRGHLKDEIMDILENSLEESYEGLSLSDNKNVILTSVLFNDITDCIDINGIIEFHSSTWDESLFSDLMVISIHKSTLNKVIEFLKFEVRY